MFHCPDDQEINHLRETLQRLAEEWSSSIHAFEEESMVCCHFGTWKWFNEEHDPLKILQLIQEIWGSFFMVLEEPDLLQTLKLLEKITWTDIILSLSVEFTTLMQIEKEWGLLHRFIYEWQDIKDVFKFLKRDFKFSDSTLNFRIFTNEPAEARSVLKDVVADIKKLFVPPRMFYNQPRRLAQHFHYILHRLQKKIWSTRSRIRSKYSFPVMSSLLSANRDVTVIPYSVLEFIDTAAENLSDLLDDPSLPACFRGQIEKVSNELKFLRNFVCFVSDRCIVTVDSEATNFDLLDHIPQLITREQNNEITAMPEEEKIIAGVEKEKKKKKNAVFGLKANSIWKFFQATWDIIAGGKNKKRCIMTRILNTFFLDVLAVAGQTTMVTWLLLPCSANRNEDLPENMDALLSDLQKRIQPIEPSVCEMYTSLLQALKLAQSPWYPIIRIDYVVHCQVGFLEMLLHSLEVLSSNSTAKKANLEENLNFWKANLNNLPIEALELHLQDMDSVLVDAGLLVYSLNEMEDQISVLDFPGKSQRMKAMIYLTTRKRFLLRFNLPAINGLASVDFIVDNLMERLCHFSNLTVSVEMQLRTIQKEIDVLRAVVELHDKFQPFATRVIGLANEVKSMLDFCKEIDVPDWCLPLWILHIVEDIKLCMIEVEEMQVEEMQEKRVSDPVLHNTPDSACASVSSHLASNPSIKEEIVGFEEMEDQVPVLDFSGKIQRMKAMIYLTTRKRFLLRFNLPAINGLASVDFIVDNLMERLCHFSDLTVSVEMQLRTIQKEIDVLRAVVELHDKFQPFATRVIGLANEVKYMLDFCKEIDVPDWCLPLWILHIVEDIKLLMIEVEEMQVEEMQEKKVSDPVLHNTPDSACASVSSHFASNPSIKEEIVGFEEMEDQVPVLDFSGKIQRMKAMIYLTTRKRFLLRFNLPAINGLASVDFIVDNLMERLCHFSDLTVSVEMQLRTIQKEIDGLRAVVELHDKFQPFTTRVIGLANEVKYMLDFCKEIDVPDWCLPLWILHIVEDIKLLMIEVEEMQENKVSDPVLHNTTDSASASVSSHFASNPSINEEIVGFEDVTVELIHELIDGSSELDVISIVGMAGLGKTTLANRIYVDELVVSSFDIHAKCCVSQEYTRKDLLLAILCDITDEKAKFDKEADNELADKLRKLLMRKRYLVLIDDIWETSAWDDLKLCFPEDNNRSRIILTTRHYEVASHAKLVSDPHKLRFFSSDESWTLLSNKVFNKECCPLVLKDVGEEIAKRCGGLPLSIVLVAGILKVMKKEKRHWEQVATYLGESIHVLSEDTLDLSYQNLPDYLKDCFLYLGVFPEDREIQVSQLTWLWVAEGIVVSHTEKLLEDTAEDYLENLIGRNLVMVAKGSSDGRIKACRIHDLVLEFCKKKAKLNNFLERIKGDGGTDPLHVFSSNCKTPERLSLYSRCDYLEKWCWSFSDLKYFQFREARKLAFSSIDCASYTFKRFKFLRVLDVEFTLIDSFPRELTLLRYLAFRTAKDTLPLPANLRNLETLIVQGIRVQVSVPDTIWKMVKLRHLHIYHKASFTLDGGEEVLASPSKMDDLQTLSSAYFSCVDIADKVLAKMPNLRKLRCEVLKFDGAFPAFNNLTKLEMLKITSGPTFTMTNQLKLPSDLKKLTLSNFHIHLNEVTALSNLEVLKLLGVTISSNIWKVNDEQFSKLKFLKIENPSFSECDISDDAFPCLEHLVLKRCRYLKVIPSCFGYMPSLKSIEVKLCKESLAESAMVIKEMQVEEMGYTGFEVFIHK